MKRLRTTNTLEMANDIVAAIGVIRKSVHPPTETSDDAMATLETFVAVALRIIAKTNPSKVRDIARLVEIQSFIPPVEAAKREVALQALADDAQELGLYDIPPKGRP